MDRLRRLGGKAKTGLAIFGGLTLAAQYAVWMQVFVMGHA
jgi:hypothetical protein